MSGGTHILRYCVTSGNFGDGGYPPGAFVAAGDGGRVTLTSCRNMVDGKADNAEFCKGRISAATITFEDTC